jgi:two-component system LytT family sensor kinase
MDAIAYLAGAALSAMLGLMQWRVDRSPGRASGYLLVWALGFIWTFGNFVREALALAHTPADSTVARLAESFAWSCTLIGPAAIGRLLQGGLGAAAPAAPAARVFVAFTLGVSLVNVVLFGIAVRQTGGRLEAGWYPATSFFMGLGIGAIALLVYAAMRRHAALSSRRRMPRWFAPTAFLIAAIHIGAMLAGLMFPGMPHELWRVINMIGQHWTIPWSVLIAASLAQAHYADVVLKRSLWLLASVTLATLGGVFVVGASGLSLLLTTMVIAALMLAAPGLVGGIARIVDRTILDRPDYAAASLALDQSLRGATQAGPLFVTALESVRHTLRVDARWVQVHEVAARSPLACVVVNPTDGAPRRLEITASHQARTLMQPELAFLAGVGTQLERRLEALRFEQEQRALLLREERLSRLLTEAELKALRTQVDPHFLFNTLNTIADLINTNPAQAERMTERLAECFRYALAKHSRALSTLDEELGFARQYLEIEQVRFGDRLQVRLSRGDALGSEAVPSLLLQPLLENAIRHGVAPVREGGCVSVHAQREGERLRLCVEDDGVGLRAEASQGVGLRNVQERLRTLYAQAAEFLIGARPGGRGTQVTIVIPAHAH